MNFADLVTLAANAGFSSANAAIAAAVALAESGGNPNVYNPETGAGAPDGEGSFGLWQIYLLDHPEFAGWNLYDPQTNANAAFSVWSAAGGSFSPWTTYNTGAYLKYLSGSYAPGGSTSIVTLSPAAAPLPSLPAFSWQTALLALGAIAGLMLVSEEFL